jgi:hypothetical protein
MASKEAPLPSPLFAIFAPKESCTPSRPADHWRFQELILIGGKAEGMVWRINKYVWSTLNSVEGI